MIISVKPLNDNDIKQRKTSSISENKFALKAMIISLVRLPRLIYNLRVKRYMVCSMPSHNNHTSLTERHFHPLIKHWIKMRRRERPIAFHS